VNCYRKVQAQTRPTWSGSVDFYCISFCHTEIQKHNVSVLFLATFYQF